MLQKIKKRSLALIFCLMMGLVVLPGGAIAANTAQDQIQCGINAATGDTTCNSAKQPSGDLGGTIAKILNILSAVTGVAAVIMLMVAAVRFVTSAGNENGVKSAKSTIVYAVVGLVLVAFAQIIVHFVIQNTT